jgi:hypothetical protein
MYVVYILLLSFILFSVYFCTIPTRFTHTASQCFLYSVYFYQLNLFIALKSCIFLGTIVDVPAIWVCWHRIIIVIFIADFYRQNFSKLAYNSLNFGLVRSLDHMRFVTVDFSNFSCEILVVYRRFFTPRKHICHYLFLTGAYMRYKFHMRNS